MAHELDRTAGKYSMAYLKDESAPWHGLGQALARGRTLEEWIADAGMGFTIERASVQYQTADFMTNGGMRQYAGRDVFYRNDTGAALGVGSKRFSLVQPREVMEFFRDLIDMMGFEMSTAGVLKGGAKFWALANMGEPLSIVGNDLIRPRLLVATSCDGSMATLVKNVQERVVCQNTLSVAIGEKGAREVKVYHDAKFDEAVIKAQLGLLPTQYAIFVKQARELAKREISPAVAENLTSALLKEPMDDGVEHSAGYRKILSLFNGGQIGADMPGVKGTTWGWLNAVTEYYDHHVRAKDESRRLDSALFGNGDQQKDAALQMALATM